MEERLSAFSNIDVSQLRILAHMVRDDGVLSISVSSAVKTLSTIVHGGGREIVSLIGVFL